MDLESLKTLGEKLAVFIKFKNEILRPYGLRMTIKDWLINFRERGAFFVILSEAKNLILLLNFLVNVFYKWI
jgi:hypothetical protein